MQEQPQIETGGKRRQFGRQSQRDPVQVLGQEQPQIKVGLAIKASGARKWVQNCP